MNKNKKLISLELSEKLIEEVKECANEEELTMSALIRKVLKEYIDKVVNEKKKNSKLGKL